MDLKWGAIRADDATMMFPADQPLDAACGELRSLYVALNSPVVQLELLPVGPASAAVGEHVAPRGVTLAVRSARTGQVAFFTSAPDGPPPDIALGAALSFAETLGFVFDDDEVRPGGADGHEAARLWRELIGESARAGAEEPVRGVDPLGDLLVIDDLLLEVPSGVDAPPERVLSKYRWALFGVAGGASVGGGDSETQDPPQAEGRSS